MMIMVMVMIMTVLVISKHDGSHPLTHARRVSLVRWRYIAHVIAAWTLE